MNQNPYQRAKDTLGSLPDIFFDGIMDFQDRPAIEWVADWTDEDEESLDQALEAINKLWCKYTTHLPTQDHCGIPDHDYCWLCGESLPNKAPRGDTGTNRG